MPDADAPGDGEGASSTLRSRPAQWQDRQMIFNCAQCGGTSATPSDSSVSEIDCPACGSLVHGEQRKPQQPWPVQMPDAARNATGDVGKSTRRSTWLERLCGLRD
jgi:DNA-directed RNA polymerase subunit RPC12/RpoP